MEKINLEYQGKYKIKNRAHVGVVGSSNLEVIFKPSSDNTSTVNITTKFDGNSEVWKAVLDQFFEEFKCILDIEINDFGATPGVVSLRLLQALEVAGIDK